MDSRLTDRNNTENIEKPQVAVNEPETPVIIENTEPDKQKAEEKISQESSIDEYRAVNFKK